MTSGDHMVKKNAHAVYQFRIAAPTGTGVIFDRYIKVNGMCLRKKQFGV